MSVRKTAAIFFVLILGQFVCRGNDDLVENKENFGADPCSKLYPTCLGCLDVSQSNGDNQCVFQIQDSEIACVEINHAYGIGPNSSAAILISVQDEAMCGLIESFIDTSFEDLDATEGSASTAQPVDEAEEEQIEDDNYDFDNSTTDESTPPAESGGVDIEPIGQEDEAEESSAPYYYGCSVMGFDFWTFFGGFFLGIGSSVIIQAFYSFYKMKKKSYNVPYQFDSFVNQ